jgi:hypothetical protein
MRVRDLGWQPRSHQLDTIISSAWWMRQRAPIEARK